LKNALAWLRSHRVAVLKGGWSRERAISLKTGASVEQALKRLKVPFQSIDVDKNILVALRRRRVQFAFIALHGEFGEDGALQCLLDFLKIPYTGSGPLASGVAMDKNLSKKLFVQHKLPTMGWVCVENKADIKKVIRAVTSYPVFVKPVDQGSAIGAGPAKNALDLERALKSCFKISSRAMVEQMLDGRELTVGILDDKALPVVEIKPAHAFYDFHSKYAPGGSRHLTPAPIGFALTKKVQRIALRAFQALGCAVYGRVDVMLTRDNRPFVLEVNTIPGMTATSLLPDAARAAGISFDQLVLDIARLSLQRQCRL
jgi:D-alanine-D-alanine ligase